MLLLVELSHHSKRKAMRKKGSVVFMIVLMIIFVISLSLVLNIATDLIYSSEGHGGLQESFADTMCSISARGRSLVSIHGAAGAQGYGM